MDPKKLFSETELVCHGPFPWKGEPISEKSSGVYAVTAVRADRELELVYIGRAKQLNKRLRQFRRHKHGNRAPHKGGEAILPLMDIGAELLIYYAPCEDYIEQERMLLERFEKLNKRLPYGNKKRGDTPLLPTNNN